MSEAVQQVDTEERDRALDVLGMIGPCTFMRDGKVLRGKVVGGSFVGLAAGRREYELLVQGASGKVVKARLVKDKVRLF